MTLARLFLTPFDTWELLQNRNTAELDFFSQGKKNDWRENVG